MASCPGDVPPPADKGFSEACPEPGPIFVMYKTEEHHNSIMYPDFTFLDWVVSQAHFAAAASTSPVSSSWAATPGSRAARCAGCSCSALGRHASCHVASCSASLGQPHFAAVCQVRQQRPSRCLEPRIGRSRAEDQRFACPGALFGVLGGHFDDWSGSIDAC